MNKSYLKNYLKIYLWQGIAILVNLLSMFIIVPRISGQPHIYGIYALCISLMIFLSYADLGFVGAGYKYASESYSRKDLPEEISFVGFSTFVLLLFVTVFSIFVVVCSFHPEMLFKTIVSPVDQNIASRLLLILGISAYAIVLQRLLQIIFGIRLEDYIYQRINIIFSLIKILSVYHFFGSEKYDIVGYFLFSQLMTFFSGVVSIIIVKKRYDYDLIQLFKKTTFSKDVYNKTKKLAFGSLYLVVCWVLYYEIDPLVIGKYFGASQIAIYAIGLTVISFLRSMFATLYAPFNARFNHFVGNKDFEGLKVLLNRLLTITLPITLIPIVSLIILIKPFVLTWVGMEYQKSILISRFLVMSYIFTFISQPAGILIVALEKIKQLYVISTIIVLVYWIGIFLTINYFSINSFALFKFIAFLIAGIFYLKILLDYLNMNVIKFVKVFLYPIIIPLCGAIIVLLVIEPFLPTGKSKLNLLLVILTGGIVSLIASLGYFISTGILKNYYEKFVVIFSRT